MKVLTLNEVELVSGGRHAEGAQNGYGPDRTRAEATRENHPGKDWTKADLRNAGLVLGAAGAIIPGIPGRVVSAIGAGSALAGGYEKSKDHEHHHENH